MHCVYDSSDKLQDISKKSDCVDVDVTSKIVDQHILCVLQIQQSVNTSLEKAHNQMCKK
ncbi:11450_t:CDS:1, partial [Cetraspora pellucida]